MKHMQHVVASIVEDVSALTGVHNWHVYENVSLIISGTCSSQRYYPASTTPIHPHIGNGFVWVDAYCPVLTSCRAISGHIHIVAEGNPENPRKICPDNVHLTNFRNLDSNAHTLIDHATVLPTTRPGGLYDANSPSCIILYIVLVLTRCLRYLNI